MILKELDPFVANDRFGAAGRKAEEQVAFYLRRGFGRDEEIRVFNGIRLEHDGDAAQIDHLVMHPHGFIIIESKSVSDSVEIDANGHWTRWFDRRPQGMPSPLNQARLQAEFLRQVLADRLVDGSGLRGLISGGVEARTYDLLVAISDNGRIRCKGALDPAIIKADEVIDSVRAVVDSRRPRLRIARSVMELGLKEMDRIADFLVENHRPLPARAAPAAVAPGLAEPPPPAVDLTPPPPPPPPPVTVSAPPSPPSPEPAAAGVACGKCGSAAVEGRWGPYGYYAKCRDCGGNTALKPVCAACGKPARVRKQGPEFHADCKACGTSALLLVNPADAAAVGGG
ncbi:nuclease-related domain-containing protein [Caenispirillum bisanense]|uniref:nuclease-related domain-containing protein n=1 Tax=Caenispirillum bisanense TaxID=414052 RepID=UPI0031D3D4D0